MNPCLDQTSETVTSTDVISLWQRILHRSPIRSDDNFFALGGDAGSADEIFRELSVRLKRELHPSLIFQAPTPASQAQLLQDSSKPKISVLIPLKPGTGSTSIFFLHGIGGSVLEFLQLVTHLDTALPMYGLQAQGTDGLEEPLASIEAMASAFLAEVRKIQPEGSYLLIGHSLGGIIALEMARQLLDTGEPIGLLSMIDAYPDRSQLNFYERARLTMRLIRKHMANLPVRRRIQQKSSEATQRVLDASFQALRNYRPRYYAGRVRFVAASIATDFPDNAHAVWKNLLPDLHIEKVAGNHREMLSLYARELGAIQTRYLREALQANAASA
jgi:acetoacetyl-CoA synthetase